MHINNPTMAGPRYAATWTGQRAQITTDRIIDEKPIEAHHMCSVSDGVADHRRAHHWPNKAAIGTLSSSSQSCKSAQQSWPNATPMPAVSCSRAASVAKHAGLSASNTKLVRKAPVHRRAGYPQWMPIEVAEVRARMQRTPQCTNNTYARADCADPLLMPQPHCVHSALCSLLQKVGKLSQLKQVGTRA